MAHTTSSEFIKKQKAKLTSEREIVLRQIAELKKDDPFLDPDHAIDNAAIDTDVREQIGHETIEAEIKDLARRVELIDIALRKVEKNQYGICERCHVPIPQARLEFIPEARYDVDCDPNIAK